MITILSYIFSSLTLFAGPVPAAPATAAAATDPAKVGETAVGLSPADVQGRVAPAVVNLGGIGKGTGPATTGVVVTASGLTLTSLRAVEAAVGGGTGLVATLAKGHSAEPVSTPGARPARASGGRTDGDRVSARVIAVAPDLDLALVELLPAAPVFYRHLPIRRGARSPGENLIPVARAAGAAGPIAAGAAGTGGADRWRRALPADAPALAGGTPLVDGIGRVAGLVVAPPDAAAAVIIDADALLRLLFAVQAPELRFAGVPPRQRPSLAAVIAARPVARPKAEPRRAAEAGAAPSKSLLSEPLELPGVVQKRALDAHFSAHEAGRDEAAEPAPSAAATKARATMPDRRGGGLADAIRLELADLDRETVPATTRIDTRDVPERGPARAPVTIIELGDYHAPDTREVEETLRALLDGPAPAVRLLWKDTDRGDGAAYHLAARAARAAGAQGQFWDLHDRLLSLGQAPTADRLKGLLRLADLDEDAFAAALANDVVTTDLQSDGKRAGRLPVLCTPAFVVNGTIVEGGSLAGPALRAAVEAELRRHPNRPATGKPDTTGILGAASSPLQLIR